MSPPSEDETSPEPDNPGGTLFHTYIERSAAQPNDLPLRCPCCDGKTLEVRGIFDICQVCFWQDDGQDDHDADVVRGGPNGRLSLTQARANYRFLGASEVRFVGNVRPAQPEERPDG